MCLLSQIISSFTSVRPRKGYYLGLDLLLELFFSKLTNRINLDKRLVKKVYFIYIWL